MYGNIDTLQQPSSILHYLQPLHPFYLLLQFLVMIGNYFLQMSVQFQPTLIDYASSFELELLSSNRMRCRQILVIVFLLLAVHGYTLLGPWRLQVDSSFVNITSNASIVFDFSKNINKDSSISNDLSVLACQVIDFKYSIDQSQISFNLAKVGVSRRECIKDQISEIIGKLQKVNFMSTINDMLLLLTASGKILIKLTKVDIDKYSKSLAGVWESYEIDSQPASVISRSNNTVLQLCGGIGFLDYYIPTLNAVSFKIRSTKGCSENDFFTALYKTQYARNFNDDLWLYNSDVDLVMKMRNLADLPGNQTITWPVVPQFRTLQVPVDSDSSTNNTQSKVSSKASASVGTSALSLKNNEVLSPPLPPTQTNKPTLSTKSRETLQASPAPVPANTVSTINKPELPLIPYSTSIRKEDILSKWFLVGAATEIMMLIVNSRIMVYGDCGVWFSLFNYRDPASGKVPIYNIRMQNTSPACLGKSNPLESNLSTLSYLTIKQSGSGGKTLQLWDQYNVISEWSSLKQK